MKLKDSKDCQCIDRTRNPGDETNDKLCRYGYCIQIICVDCGLPWCEMGPIDCPHKKNENGTLRWYKYPDMDEKIHVAIKGNIMRKPKRLRARNW